LPPNDVIGTRSSISATSMSYMQRLVILCRTQYCGSLSRFGDRSYSSTWHLWYSPIPTSRLGNPWSWFVCLFWRDYPTGWP